MGQLSFSAPELRHTQGFQGWEGAVGMTSMGPLLGAGYSQYLNRAWYWKAGLSMQHKTRAGVSYHHFSVHPALCRCFWQPTGRCYVNLLGAMLLTYEGHYERGNTTSNFNLGLAVGTELEYFLNGYLALLLSFAPHYYFLASPYRNLGYCLASGIKWSF